jgi:N-acetylmuramoyl-L-alanine amidase
MPAPSGRALRSSGSIGALIVVSAAIFAACSGSASSSAVSVARPAATAGAASTQIATDTSARVSRRSALVASVPVGSGRRRSVGARRAALPLAGQVVGIDPGHNGRNYTDPTFINHLIWNGREQEACDTTGTETDGGYTEAQFNFNVATFLAADLRAEGAKVVLTRTTNDGVGPCVTTRAEIINRAHANVAIDIHADGGPPDGRGFAILEPVADGPNDRVIAASFAFGRILRQRYGAVTAMPVSTYDGVDGLAARDNLAGLNLTTVPKVLIECGNMRNATDAALLVRSSFQKLAATALTEAITQYLTARG